MLSSSTHSIILVTGFFICSSVWFTPTWMMVDVCFIVFNFWAVPVDFFVTCFTVCFSKANTMPEAGRLQQDFFYKKLLSLVKFCRMISP